MHVVWLSTKHIFIAAAPAGSPYERTCRQIASWDANTRNEKSFPVRRSQHMFLTGAQRAGLFAVQKMRPILRAPGRRGSSRC